MRRILITVLTVIIGTSLLFGQTTMSTALRSATYEGSLSGYGVIPATDPYLGTVTVNDGLPENMVDWVLVELRATSNGATIAQAVGCLLNDGSVTDTTGLSGLTFEGLESNTPYYVIVRHRNHLAVMSAEGVLIDDTNTGYDVDLTGGNVYGGASLAMKQVGTEYAMTAGDADSNNFIQTTDKNAVWNLQTGMSGYRESDFDLNGFVQTTDKNNYYVKNVGKASQIPSQN